MPPVATYTEVLKLSHRMRDAAEAADWETLTDLGRTRDALIVQLPATTPRMPRAEALELAKAIQDILDCNDRIRELAEPWLRQVKPLLAALAPQKPVVLPPEARDR